MNQIIDKAIVLCEQYRDGRITRSDWAKGFSELHYKDCGGDPELSAWLLFDCADLLPQDDWDWFYEQSQSPDTADDSTEQLSLL
jgi:hypothetical protein